MAGNTMWYYRNYSSSDTTNQSAAGSKVADYTSFGWTAPEGYEFGSWNTAQDGSGDSYQAGDSTPPDKYYMYAMWVSTASVTYLVTDTELAEVADAIRTKGGTSAALEWPDGFVDAVGAIGGSISSTAHVIARNSNAIAALDIPAFAEPNDTVTITVVDRSVITDVMGLYVGSDLATAYSSNLLYKTFKTIPSNGTTYTFTMPDCDIKAQLL